MKIWLPYVRCGSGADVFVKMLAAGLREAGVIAVEQSFPHRFQYAPWLLLRAKCPENTNVVVANTWNGFAFRRPPAALVTIEHHLVSDDALRPYRTFAQAVFHETLVKRYEHSSIRASDAQVAVSEYTARLHRRVFKGREPLVIRNGVDTNFFTPDMALKRRVEGEPVRLLFIGNLTSRKGVDLLPPIMRQLGDGYSLEYAVGLRAADSLDELPNARSLGRMALSELRNAYQRADLLIFPSRLEGFGLVAAEAMACGTPVVATNATALPEIVGSEGAGRLCARDDPYDFANSVRELSANQSALHKAGVAARSRIVKSFSLERMVGEYIRLFEQLVSRGARYY